MHIPALKHFRPMFFTGLLCLAAALVLSSCSKKPQQAILGKWNAAENNSIVEFRTDGTVTTLNKGTTISSKYKFLSDTNMELEATAAAGTNQVVVRMTCGIVIHGDTAELALDLPSQGGAPPKGQTMHLTRVK